MDDITSKEEDLMTFRATLVEDMTSKEEDLNGISSLSNPSGGYDTKGRGFDDISSNPSGGYVTK